MAEKCPCETDVQSCCACVSMHCDECHKPIQSKFVQGRYCSNCGRPLKAELTQTYVTKKEIANVLSDLKIAVHNKAFYNHAKEIPTYITLKVFDAIIQDYIKKYEKRE